MSVSSRFMCVIVLFSAGIGRTGTFIVIDMILYEIKKHGLCRICFLIHINVLNCSFAAVVTWQQCVNSDEKPVSSYLYVLLCYLAAMMC